MAVKIKLARIGKIREPFYRIVVADSRTAASGRSIEAIGKYHPENEPSLIEIDSERAQYWLGVGAQPTESVEALLKVTGDWQKFKGLPGTEGTLKPQPIPRSTSGPCTRPPLPPSAGRQHHRGDHPEERSARPKAEAAAERRPPKPHQSADLVVS